PCATCPNDKYTYELKDATGSVRAVIDREKDNTGKVQLISYTSYYAYGEVITSMSNTLINTTTKRYGYQGEWAESNEQTGLVEFDLRQYDPEIGRWLSPDPMHQHFSPYLAMGNNPVSSVDMDGGQSGPTGGGSAAFASAYGAAMNAASDATAKASLNLLILATAKGVSQGGSNNLKILIDQPQPNIEENSNFKPRFFLDTEEKLPSQKPIVKIYNEKVTDSDLANSLGIGLDVGELALHAKTYQIFGTSIENLEKTLGENKFIHTNGKTYSQNFRGNKFITSKSLLSSKNTGKLIKGLGKGILILGLGTSVYQFASSDQSGADYARLTGSFIITGTSFIPYAGPFISIGLGIADGFGAFDPIYNSFDE
ncbi:MAG: RHS repeat domain-containing protein, partial [Fusobacteriaceae bacterium]